MTAKPFFGYTSAYYNTDLLSGKNVGEPTATTAELKAYDVWSTTPEVYVSSKVAFEAATMLDAGGAPAEGRFIIVIGPK